jgi:hypothetical protein
MLAAVFAAAILAAGAIGCGRYINLSAKELGEYAENIEIAICRGDFDEAQSGVLRLSTVLDDKKEILGAIVDHGDIYEIQRNLAELSRFIEEKDVAESRARCGAISAGINQLSGNSSPALFNIL